MLCALPSPGFAGMRRSLSWQRPKKKKAVWFGLALPQQPLVQDGGRSVPGVLPAIRDVLSDTSAGGSQTDYERTAEPSVVRRLRDRLESGEASAQLHMRRYCDCETGL